MSLDNETPPLWMEKFRTDMLKQVKSDIHEAMAIQNTKMEALELKSVKQSSHINMLRRDLEQTHEILLRLESRSMQEIFIFSGLPESSDETSQDIAYVIKSS